MSKFKEGDRVRVAESVDEEWYKYKGVTIYWRNRACFGTIGVVKSIQKDQDMVRVQFADGYTNWWRERDLTLVDENGDPIVEEATPISLAEKDALKGKYELKGATYIIRRVEENEGDEDDTISVLKSVNQVWIYQGSDTVVVDRDALNVLIEVLTRIQRTSDED